MVLNSQLPIGATFDNLALLLFVLFWVLLFGVCEFTALNGEVGGADHRGLSIDVVKD